MKHLSINLSKITDLITSEELIQCEKQAIQANDTLHNKTGKGNDFLGWIDLPAQIDESLISSIENHAKMLAEKAKLLVVIGIGGSYLGARAVIDALSSNFEHLTPLKERKSPYIVYAGNNINEDYHAELMDLLDNNSYATIVISKSGTTTEPAIAFRLIKQHLENKYGKAEAKNRIIAITDKAKGALKKLADLEGYFSYVIPDDVGGRYSVLTPVGLLPIAAAGFNIRSLVKGAEYMRKLTINGSKMAENIAMQYAIARNLLYKKGKTIEILASFTPNLHFIIEWWKQLYGESEGKELKGIFPAGVDFTADLHSMGQYIQEGQRCLFETTLNIEQSRKQLLVPIDHSDGDGLNFIANKKLHEVNRMAELGTLLAHVDGDVPNIQLSLPMINEEYIGELVYFFEKACAISGYLLGVNPFDQPGVEAYKKNMFALLGKPGFEKQTEDIKKRIQ